MDQTHPHCVFFPSKFDEVEYNLIVLVKQFRRLYDPSNKYYNDAKKTSSAWRYISEELGKPPEWCASRWENLLTFYSRRKRIGLRGDDFPNWPYDKDMKFIDPYTGIPPAPKFNKFEFSGGETGAGSTSRTRYPFPVPMAPSVQEGHEIADQTETCTCCRVM